MSGLLLLCVNACISTDLSALLALYSVSRSAMYLGPRPLSDL